MKHLLFVFFLALNFCGFSQLKVVKDNVECLYGIKSEGKWVVEPSYILIQQTRSNYFLLTDNTGTGLMDYNLNIILSCTYNQIEPIERSWRMVPHNSLGTNSRSTAKDFFVVTTDQGTGLVNRWGRLIVPIRQDQSYNWYPFPSLKIIQNREGETYSSLIDSSGLVLLPELKGEFGPFNSAGFALVYDSDKQSRATGFDNVGVIDRKGKVVVKRQYESAKLCGDSTMVILMNGKIGKINFKGDTLLAPEFEFVKIKWSGLFCLEGPNPLLVKNEAGKFGFINGDGEELLAPIYDRIYQSKRSNSNSSRWTIELDGKIGFADENGRVSVEPIYDSLIYFDGYRGLSNAPIMVRKDGKFGLITENEMNPNDLPFDSFFTYHERGQRCMFFKEGVAFDYNLNSSLKFDTLLYLRSYKNIKFYKNADRTVPMVIDVQTKKIKSIGISAADMVTFGSFLVLREEQDSCLIFTKSGRRWNADITYIDIYSNEFAVIRNSEQKYGVINKHGDIVLDAKYVSVDLGGMGENMVWTSRYVYRAPKWDKRHLIYELRDTNFNKSTNMQFSSAVSMRGAKQIIQKDGKSGLLNTKTFEWILKPEFKCMTNIGTNLLSVVNSEYKYGIVDYDGKVVLPVVYDSLFCVYTGRHNFVRPPIDSNTLEVKKNWQVFWWFARYNGVEFLINNKREKIVNRRQVAEKLKGIALGDDPELPRQNTVQNSLLFSSGYYKELQISLGSGLNSGLTYETIDKEEIRNSTLRDALYDTLLIIYEVPYTDPYSIVFTPIYQVAIEGTEGVEKQERPINCNPLLPNKPWVFHLNLMTDSVFSLNVSQTSQYGWGMGGPLPVLNYVNCALVNGKAKYLTLEDIFGDGSYLYLEFVNAIEQRDDLNLDCSALTQINTIVGDRFHLSHEGVVLHLNQEILNGNRQNPDVLIPWSRLLEEDMSRWLAQRFVD